MLCYRHDKVFHGRWTNLCISICEQMKNHCSPNIGTINMMLKVVRHTYMFSKAKESFEETKAAKSDSDPLLEGGGNSLVPNEYTYTSMLKASASALQWEYIEYVYREMALSGYRIDQSKNASILGEASRTGKGYLLEHAFDTTLEAGEIPRLIFFIEMVYQLQLGMITRERQLWLRQWFMPHFKSVKSSGHVFKKNEDGVSQDGIKKLLDALEHCDVTSAATLLNLKSSLHSLCRSYTSSDFSDLVSVSSLDDNDEGSDDNEGFIMPNHSLGYINGKMNPGTDPPDDSSDAPFSEFPRSSSIRSDCG